MQFSDDPRSLILKGICRRRSTTIHHEGKCHPARISIKSKKKATVQPPSHALPAIIKKEKRSRRTPHLPQTSSLSPEKIAAAVQHESAALPRAPGRRPLPRFPLSAAVQHKYADPPPTAPTRLLLLQFCSLFFPVPATASACAAACPRRSPRRREGPYTFQAYFPRYCQEPAPGGWRCFPSTPSRRGTRRCRLRQLSLAVTLQARLPLQRLVELPTPEFLSASRCRRKAPCSWPRTRRRSKEDGREDLERAEEMKFRCTELLRRME